MSGKHLEKQEPKTEQRYNSIGEMTTTSQRLPKPVYNGVGVNMIIRCVVY